MGPQVRGEQVRLGKDVIVEQEEMAASGVSREAVAGLPGTGVLKLQDDGAHGPGSATGEGFGGVGAGVGLGMIGVASIDADKHLELIARQRLACEAFEAAGELVGPAAGGDENADEHAPIIGGGATHPAQVRINAQTGSTVIAE